MSLTAVSQLDVELGWRGERSLSLDVLDTILFEQERLDTAGKRLDRGVLGSQHSGKVELDISDVDTSALEVVLRLVVDVRVVQPEQSAKIARHATHCCSSEDIADLHSFGGDTSDVQTGSTKSSSLFDTSSLKSASIAKIEIYVSSPLLTFRPSWAALIAAT